MKKNISFVFEVIAAALLLVIVNKAPLQGGEGSSIQTVDELGWHRGEIPMEAMQPMNSPSISSDWSRDISSLNNYAMSAMFNTARDLTGCSNNDLLATFSNRMIPGSGPWLGAALTLYELNKNLMTAAQVGRGEASPEKLRNIIPHVIGAWDKIKGPENLAFSSSIIPIASYKDSGFQKIQEFGYIKMDRQFFTTAPREIGRYGFDPYTDTSMRNNTSRFVRSETIGMQPVSPNICNSPNFYTPHQSYTPTKIYTPSQSYTPVHIPTQTYTPSRK